MIKVKKVFGRPVTIVFILLLTLLMGFQTVQAAEKVELVTGTYVYVETMNKLDPNTLKSGDNITLVVAGDVTVNKKVVIKAGTPVEAVVTKAEKSGIVGKAGEIGIRVRTTKAVDGTVICLPVNAMFLGIVIP